MLGRYLEHGVVAGVIGGIWYGLFIAIVGNPLLEYLEAINENAVAAGVHSDVVVSTVTTLVVSVGSGVVWGIMLGLAFGVAFYLVEPALPGPTGIRVLALAVIGFLVVSGIPWLVLPPAVPGAPHAIAPTDRIMIYIGLVLAGSVLAAAAIYVYHAIAHQRSPVVGGMVWCVVLIGGSITIAMVTPTFSAVGDTPPELVWVFRGLVAMGQFTLWGIIAGSFYWLRDRDRPAIGIDDPVENPLSR